MSTLAINALTTYEQCFHPTLSYDDRYGRKVWQLAFSYNDMSFAVQFEHTHGGPTNITTRAYSHGDCYIHVTKSQLAQAHRTALEHGDKFNDDEYFECNDIGLLQRIELCIERWRALQMIVSPCVL